MTFTRQPHIARVGRIVYGNLLCLYPAELRCKFGDEMLDVFSAQLCDAIAEGKPAEVFSLWRSALWELLTVAVPCRLSSNEVLAGALSFLASAALFLVFFRAVS